MRLKMQARQVVAIVIVIAILALTLGAFVGYSSSSGRTSTTTQTTTMTNSYGTLFLQSTTYTTVSSTTLSFGGSTYATTTGEYSGCIPPVQCYLTTVTTVIYLSTPPPNSTSTTFVGSQTSFDITFIACCDTSVTSQFYYPISVNYSGSWNLVYWVENGRQKSDVIGNLTGSGDYDTTITFYVVGYAEDTLCANATKLNSQNNLTLTLSVLGQTNSTTASDLTAEVCATMGV